MAQPPLSPRPAASAQPEVWTAWVVHRRRAVVDDPRFHPALSPDARWARTAAVVWQALGSVLDGRLRALDHRRAPISRQALVALLTDAPPPGETLAARRRPWGAALAHPPAGLTAAQLTRWQDDRQQVIWTLGAVLPPQDRRVDLAERVALLLPLVQPGQVDHDELLEIWLRSALQLGAPDLAAPIVARLFPTDQPIPEEWLARLFRLVAHTPLGGSPADAENETLPPRQTPIDGWLRLLRARETYHGDPRWSRVPPGLDVLAQIQQWTNWAPSDDPTLTRWGLTHTDRPVREWVLRHLSPQPATSAPPHATRRGPV